jgi:hypothetical protein
MRNKNLYVTLNAKEGAMPDNEEVDPDSRSFADDPEGLEATRAYASAQEEADKAEEAEEAADKKRRLAALQEELAASPILKQLKSPRTGTNPLLD